MRSWKGPGPEVVTHPRPRETGIIPCHLVAIVLFVSACVKQIMELGRRFPWPRPERCPRCGSVRLWGHGFVVAYFDDVPEAVFLKRYRCPDCRAVIRLRPRGYWSRFQASAAAIRQSLFRKLIWGRWDPRLPRSRQRHWLKGLLRQVGLHLGSAWSGDLLWAFDCLHERGLAAASRSAQSESPFPP